VIVGCALCCEAHCRCRVCEQLLHRLDQHWLRAAERSERGRERSRGRRTQGEGRRRPRRRSRGDRCHGGGWEAKRANASVAGGDSWDRAAERRARARARPSARLELSK
jgi:hypothetical protein